MERLIYTGPDFCAVEENGLLVEYIRQETVRQSGDILTGTVDRIMPGIGGAFVNIGRSRAGFLPLSENSLTFSSVPLQSGMRVTVQIRKEETGGKGAFLSRDLALPGSLVILMPSNRYIGVSNRIQDESVREKLRLLGQQIAGGRTGLVMREACMRAGHEEIRNEFTQLMDLWDSLSLQNHVRDTAGTVLFHSDPISQMLS